MIARLIEFALNKPLLNHMLLLFILLLSVFAYLNIPKEIFPPVQMDKITITGGYAGASADVLDKMVVTTIEDELGNISELETVTTTIKNGAFTITADIKPGSQNINVLNDVKDIIAQTKRDLPSDMNEPIAQIHEEMIPLVLVAIAGEAPMTELLERADELKSALSRYKELSDITIRGDSDDELVFRIDPDKLDAYGLSTDAVVSALQNLSSIFPVGTVKRRGEHLYISTYNGEKDETAIENTVIGVGGKRVKIGQIATATFELGDATELSHYNGVRNVSVNITKSKSGNAIALAKQIRETLKGFEKRYPDLQFAVYTDTSVWIKNRLNTVVSNIIVGLILVFAAMLIFVNRGIALVVAMGIPMSFMIGLIATEMIGYSLNMLSLLGALIALGMLVDEAIVVAENIYRHMEEGMPRREAAIQGAVEMFPAVLTATLTTVFAFLPMLLISGEMGTFIKILPVMITILLLSSLFEAFFFLPLHAHELLRLRRESHVSHSIWEHLYRWYDKTLHLLFRRRKRSLFLIVGAIAALTAVMVSQSRFQLFPPFDVTQVYVTGKVNINNELEDTEQRVAAIERMLLEKLDPEEYSSVTAVIGMRLDAKNKAEIGENLFQVFIDLHERAPDNWYNRYINPIFSIEYNAEVLKRQRDAKAISEDVKRWLEPLAQRTEEDGTKTFENFNVTVPGTGVVAHDIELALEGKNDTELAKGVKVLEAALADVTGVYNISDDADLGERELKLRINDYGYDLGLTEADISRQLRAHYLKGEYGKMFSASGLVRIRIESVQKDDPESLESFRIQIPGSTQTVALRDVADFIYTQAYVTIEKEDGARIRSVYASLDKDIRTSSEVMAAIAPTLEELRKEGFDIEIKGEEKENAKTQREMSQAAAVAIFLIFITLVWLFDSLVLALIVLSTIPLVLVGVYVGHWVMGLTITMPSLIGAVGLAGVVVNDGLIMVSFIRQARDSEALMRRARTRLRPILMTSITTVLGLMTLIFFASGQAQILQPMAVSLGYGILWATVLNLFYVPLLYAVIYRIKR
ncbi:efflux RND transporter permease subunit [Sulfurimonas sp. HSL1-6]|uniref:efflux RND transporter permease subunit n=1 Tax=Thiomicrolovo immobilis TaxID=3131935 RepID=UPI0031F78A64